MPDTIKVRPPIVAIVGHIDHGKSTLLDYIRRANVVEGEAGGITQHLSAYEAEHENSSGKHRITFLDTPGHAAFAAMRSRGLEVADVAILVVSSEVGVKPQTVEALKLIESVKIPFIVALTKIDKPAANIERAKMSLLENNIFIEGMGGEVPWVAVSGKTGEGHVIEAHVDQKRGNTATLIVENGAIESGEYIISGEAIAPVRIMENFLGKKIKEALPGSPVMIVGFSVLPTVGATWRSVETKKVAEEDAAIARAEARKNIPASISQKVEPVEGAPSLEEKVLVILPLVIKTDVAGTGEAVLHELEKLPKDERLEVRIVSRTVGTINENDVRVAGAGAVPGIIVGFGVKVDREAQTLAERLGVEVKVFDIIYKLTEWLGAEIEKRIPLQSTEVATATAKILKVFSAAKGRVVLGGRVESGALAKGSVIKVTRNFLEVARGSIVSLQTQKRDVSEVGAGSEFGAMVKLSNDPQAGDTIESFEVEMQ